jgi:hypothetical protein
MTIDSYIWLLVLAIVFGILAGMLKAFLSNLRSKRKAQAPLLGVVLPNTQNLVTKQTSKHKDKL